MRCRSSTWQFTRAPVGRRPSNGAAIFWRARPTSFMGRTSGCALRQSEEKLEELDVRQTPARTRAGAREAGDWGRINHEGIVSTAAAVDYSRFTRQASRRYFTPARGENDHGRRLRGIAWARVRRLLKQRHWEGPEDIDGITLYGPPPAVLRTPTLAHLRWLAGPAEEVTWPSPHEGSLASRTVTSAAMTSAWMRWVWATWGLVRWAKRLLHDR